MKRPIIGITTSYADGKQSVDHTYIQAIEAANGVPLIVPMLSDAAAADALSALLDGLLMTGGPGITTGLIGSLPQDLAPVDPVRHTSDMLIYERFAQDERPVFGICYGMQFINAQAGGTLYGDLSAHIDTPIAHSTSRGGKEHAVMLEPDSHIAQALGTTALTANTYHIQALASVGSGFRVVGTSPDGVIEAIESADGRQIGVQFHPERMQTLTAPLFADFVRRCARGE